MLHLREHVNALLCEASPQRRPALRRSRLDEYLFATDLPAAVRSLPDGALRVEAFKSIAAGEKWLVAQEGDWLMLDMPIRPEDLELDEPLNGVEMQACLSMLKRHHSPADPPAFHADEIRCLAKAADKGIAEVECVCRQWHQAWAAQLRKKEHLPVALQPYLEMLGRGT